MKKERVEEKEGPDIRIDEEEKEKKETEIEVVMIDKEIKERKKERSKFGKG